MQVIKKAKWKASHRGSSNGLTDQFLTQFQGGLTSFDFNPAGSKMVIMDWYQECVVVDINTDSTLLGFRVPGLGSSKTIPH